jgi:transposase
MQSVVGVDVSKDTLDVVILQDEKSKHKIFRNTTEGHKLILEWIHTLAGQEAHVCLEATGRYGLPFAEYLVLNLIKVSVVNPARIKAYADSKLNRNKTDKVDALLIAMFCLREKPDLWTPPPAHIKELQALVRHLDSLQNILQQEMNRNQSGNDSPKVNQYLEEHILFLRNQITNLKKDIQQHIRQNQELRHQQDLLMSIPGIGELTSAKLLGEITRLNDFSSAKQLAAYAGLTPRNRRSGTSVHKKPRMSKTGNAHLRRALYMPAVVARRWNPVIKSFSDRLTNNGLRPMQVIGASMRKLLHIAYGVLKNDIPFDPNYCMNTEVIS